MRVLLAVRSPERLREWEPALAERGHAVLRTAPALPGLLELWRQRRAELVIAERLPGAADVFDFCRELRRLAPGARPATLVLLPDSHAGELIAALKAGADDALAGAQEPRTVRARLAALEARAQPAPAPAMHELAGFRRSQRPSPDPAGPEPPADAPPADAALDPVAQLERALALVTAHAGAAQRRVADDAHASLELSRVLAAARTATHALAELRARRGAPAEPVPAPSPVAGAGDPPAPGPDGSDDAAHAPLVLLADDDPLVRAPLRRALEHLGLRVLEAGDGEEALELHRRRAGEVALAVIDQRMPRLSGWVVLGELKRRRPHLPVVLVSGHAFGELSPSRRPVMPDAFLKKPFQLGEFGDTVRRLLADEALAATV